MEDMSLSVILNMWGPTSDDQKPFKITEMDVTLMFKNNLEVQFVQVDTELLGALTRKKIFSRATFEEKINMWGPLIQSKQLQKKKNK